MAKKEKKERKARKPKKEEAPEVEETPEEQPEEVVEEEAEEKASPKEKATEIASGPKKETEEKAEEAEEAPKRRRGFFPGTTRHGGHEMKPQPKLELDLSPCEDMDEAIERVGGEEVVKTSKEYPNKFVVVFGENMNKAEFPKAE